MPDSNADNLVTAVTSTYAGMAGSVTVNYQYDPAGFRRGSQSLF